MLKITKEEKDIADRFFKALDVLADMRRIRGLKTFSRAHNINYGSFNTIKNHRDRRTVKTVYLAYLAEDYGVSCEWLLLGTGEMFNSNSSKT